jgi:hypothetical protein
VRECGKGCVLGNTGKVSKGTYKFGDLGLKGWIWSQFTSHAVTANAHYYGSIGVGLVYKGRLGGFP